MPKVTCLYIDDSGTRNPNHKSMTDQFRDWFALGGLLVHEEDEDAVRSRYQQFCGRWGISYALHSSEIRSRTGNFSWLQKLPTSEYNSFMRDLSDLLVQLPVMGYACVIDRPGYEVRYRQKYGRQQWLLCKTAFAIVCERAAKLARMEDRKLRVYPESGDRSADSALRGYFRELREIGMPFGGKDAGKYSALTAPELRDTLYDLKFKNKSSPMAQLADLYLYPIARGGYDPAYRPYQLLVENKKLVDAHLVPEQLPHLGIKYSCFELVSNTPNNIKAGVDSGFHAAPIAGTS